MTISTHSKHHIPDPQALDALASCSRTLIRLNLLQTDVLAYARIIYVPELQDILTQIAESLTEITDDALQTQSDILDLVKGP